MVGDVPALLAGLDLGDPKDPLQSRPSHESMILNPVFSISRANQTLTIQNSFSFSMKFLWQLFVLISSVLSLSLDNTYDSSLKTYYVPINSSLHYDTL